MKNEILGSFRLKYLIITILAYLSALVICCVISALDDFPDFSEVLFDLAVIVTARFTDGFIYSTLSALIGSVTVSYAFTYPYLSFGFSITQAALTFILMLVTAIIISMLTYQIKIHAKAEIIAERNAVRAELLRSLSHNLRTPLTTMAGTISAFRENYDSLSDETRKHLTDDAHKQVQSLVKMVENILAITKMEDSAAINMKSEAVEEAISSAVRLFKEKNPDVNIRINIPTEPIFVRMDSMLISQVLINLMDNSVKHGENVSEIEIFVEKNSRKVTFRVSDNGTGIKPEVLEHLFNSMPKCTDSDNYMRIGLSMCKSAVMLHGGEIKGYNNNGAVFEFDLPLNDSTDDSYLSRLFTGGNHANQK